MKSKYRQQRLAAFTVALLVGLPAGLRSVWHFLPDPAIYQRVIWTIGTVGVCYTIAGIVILAVTK